VEILMVPDRAGAGHVEVDAGHVIWMAHGDSGGHLGAPVAALRPITGVAKAAHQLIPGVGDVRGSPAGLARLPLNP